MLTLKDCTKEELIKELNRDHLSGVKNSILHNIIQQRYQTEQEQFDKDHDEFKVIAEEYQKALKKVEGKKLIDLSDEELKNLADLEKKFYKQARKNIGKGDK